MSEKFREMAERTPRAWNLREVHNSDVLFPEEVVVRLEARAFPGWTIEPESVLVVIEKCREFFTLEHWCRLRAACQKGIERQRQKGNDQGAAAYEQVLKVLSAE